MDSLQRFFVRPFFLGTTVGIPFCLFKILFGLTAWRLGDPGGPLAVFGLLVMLWASIDLLMNLGRAVLDLLQRPAPFEYCTLAQLGRLFDMSLIFLAIDTLLSFAIICTMLWTGWIATLGTGEARVWYAATTLNLISLSLVSLFNEIRRRKLIDNHSH